MAKRGRPKGSTNKNSQTKAPVQTKREGNRIVNKGPGKTGNQNSLSVKDMRDAQKKGFDPTFAFGGPKRG